MLARVIPLLALLSVACDGEQRAVESEARKPPVFLISIDTLRSDHLPAYGYRHVRTPHIDSLRRDSILFERAYSHSPLTLPSHGSILTGTLPSVHGLRDNSGFTMTANVATLAELLKKQGYATGAAVSAFVLREETGIARGFDYYDDDIIEPSLQEGFGRAQRPGSVAIDRAKTWIKSQAAPCFFFLHIYEPHTPYEPPKEYRNLYANAYDGEIAFSDALIGDFLTFLKESDLYEDAVIVFLSDHGEGLNDHGEEEHGLFLYREAIQVPLLLKLPERRLAGTTSADPAQLIDVVPTILELTTGRRGDATSLVSLAESPRNSTRRSIYSESFFPRIHFGWSDLHSLISGDYHYIEAPSPELYDLGRDPAERSNILAANRRVYAQMRQAIKPSITAAAEPAPVDPETAARLAALGYVSGQVRTGANESLPDPKTQISTLRRINEAMALVNEQRYAEALPLLERLVAANPRMSDIREAHVRSLVKLNRPDDAISSAKAGLRNTPWNSNLAIVVAALSLQLNRLEDAARHAELALESEPGEAHELLARIALARRDVTTAKNHAANAARLKRNAPATLFLLGQIEQAEKNYQDALRYYDEVRRATATGSTPLQSLNLFRGAALAETGKLAEAEEAFREEIRHFPADSRAYLNLILVLVMQQRRQEASEVVYQLIRSAPHLTSYLGVVEVMTRIGDRDSARVWAKEGLRRYPDNPALRQAARG